ncbi:SDR family oxidoreductase [Microbacterium hydrocarbonoxydans]|uniref:NAD(P)H dehydrogenase (Quinone) n=1 Tax=Microbacterium hydrocarbonoxydans TaxID=273678 RepID=A0A1H4PTX8_9MICO|nr:SDR family oxidoreductase [Microbacterium hydrocarbonoxydans]SEC10632.1 NAD(P)H dehydrogenase (quinone) [Microbacterium hydrocarbonoxydans]
MTILVTGATGNLGRLVIESLLERGADPQSVIAGARDVTKAEGLGVRVARVDYSDPASVRSALEGVDTVLLVSGSEVGQRVAQHKAVIDAAKDAGVAKLVYTSAPKATTSDLVLAPEHKATEELIAASGVPSVILRNNWYTENYAADLARAAETGVLASGAGAGRVASASRKDFAEAAAVVLLDEGHLGQVYELGGDVAWNYDDLAGAIAEISGRDVAYQPLTADEQLAGLRAAGLDEGTAGFVVALDAGIAAGALADTDGTLSRLIGRPTTPLVEGLRAIA